jgi:DNA-binding CsgD family transcriptional regulator/tetratricopeptide (TPR) repeat protein
MLHGRRAECDALERLLADARRSRSGVLVVRGEAGVGKSALLDHAAGRAEGMVVLRASGVESEAELPFAALHQLLRPVLGLVERLPAAQAAALGGALGLGLPGDRGSPEARGSGGLMPSPPEARGSGGLMPSPPEARDRFLVSVAVLSLLAEAAEDRPVLCLVDEAQWLDDSSAQALTFAARRLEAEGVALLFAARDGDPRDFSAPGLPELRLQGLDPDAAAGLLAAAGVDLPAEVVERLVERTGGNPLALLELPGSLEPGQLAGRAPLEDVLPLTTRLAQAFGERVRRLPEASRTVLLVAAAETAGDPAVVLRAGARLGVGPDALEEAESAGLVQTGGGRLRFRHPLVRSATYQAATLAARQAAHRALAEVLAGEDAADQRAWHLASATVGPDEAVAAGLEDSADRARRRGGHAAAAAALERAAELTGDDAERGRRLAAAADAAWLAGQADRAAALLDRADPLGADPRSQATAAHLRGLIEASRGVALEAAAMLVAGSELAAPVDPSQALQMLVEASEIASYAGDVAPTAELGRRAAALPVVDKAGEFLSDLLQGMGRVAEGDGAAGEPLLRRAIALAGTLEHPRRLMWAGMAALFVGEFGTVNALYARAVARARQDGAVGLLPQALEYLAPLELVAGRLDAATATATEGLRLARDTGNDTSACRNLATLAHLAALRGDEDACRGFAAEALDRAAARGLGLPATLAGHALALLELGLNRPAEALVRLQGLLGAGPGAGSPFFAVYTVPDLVEAAVRAGQAGAATAPLAAFEQLATLAGTPEVLAQLARCRGLLAPDEAAPAHFEEALALHDGLGRPFDLARTELAYGEALRRARRRGEARTHLRGALEIFQRLGAAPWAERAGAELRATGESARRRDPGAFSQLTPQELQIIRLVGEGGTNREIGAQLFLSRRTIDYHLRNVFVKLGVSSRAELIRLQLTDR